MQWGILLAVAAGGAIGSLLRYFVASAIQARRDAGFEASQTIVVTNIGKRTMDSIRAIVARMEAREEALLTLRTAEAESAYNTARLTAAAQSFRLAVAPRVRTGADLRQGATQWLSGLPLQDGESAMVSLEDGSLLTAGPGRAFDLLSQEDLDSLLRSKAPTCSKAANCSK